jgi:arylsulfatase A-like enzyme
LNHSSGKILLVALWLGIFAGLIEGCLLILFQRLNWQNWGAMLHGSAPIIWISPIVDVIFFVAAACLICLLGTLFRRVSWFAVTFFTLSFLTVYDWLTLTGRLYRVSCLLLAIGVAVVVSRWAARNELRREKFIRRTTPVLILIWFITFAIIHWGSRWQERRELARLPAANAGAPNVLIIVIDTLRADHLSSYGYARQTSPNIDRIAGEGVLFENAISPTPWSLPSHVSLLTGRYQFQHRISDIPPMSAMGLRASEMNGFTTLGEILARHGYLTAAFSANLVNFTANLGFHRGFMHFEDYFQNSADAFVRTIYGREFARMYLNRSEHSKVKRLLRWLGWNSILDRSDEGSIKSLGVLGVEKRAATVNRELLRWIDSGPRDHPFFAFLNYIDVHHPYGGPPSYKQPWPARVAVDQYDDGIKYVDDCIGELMHELQARGLAENTLLIITSDHGESLGDHKIAFHGESLYREQVHVPLIFRFPARIPPERVTALVSSASIPATVLNVFSLPSTPDFKLPAIDSGWKNSQSGRANEVLSEVAQLYPASEEDIMSEKVVPVSMAGAMKSLTTTQNGLITHEKLGDQLYDYVRDPAEGVDQFGSPQGQQIASTLFPEMQTIIAGGVPFTSATHIRDGVNDVHETLFRLSTAAGQIVSFELDDKSAHSSFKPVLSILDASGKLLRTCKAPSDDHIPPPGSPDLTPDAFDDLCINTMSANAGANLQIVVPAESRTPVELYVRVSDWDGRQIPANYQIVVSSSASK